MFRKWTPQCAWQGSLHAGYLTRLLWENSGMSPCYCRLVCGFWLLSWIKYAQRKLGFPMPSSWLGPPPCEIIGFKKRIKKIYVHSSKGEKFSPLELSAYWLKLNDLTVWESLLLFGHLFIVACYYDFWARPSSAQVYCQFSAGGLCSSGDQIWASCIWSLCSNYWIMSPSLIGVFEKIL